MELIYNALDELPPEGLDKQGAPFIKDLARTGTINLGILIDKLAKDEEFGGSGISINIVVPAGQPQDTKRTEQPVEDQPTQDVPTVEVEVG